MYVSTQPIGATRPEIRTIGSGVARPEVIVIGEGQEQAADQGTPADSGTAPWEQTETAPAKSESKFPWLLVGGAAVVITATVIVLRKG